jgi:oligopeptide transport system permease protein
MQFLRYLGGVVQGDFGPSYSYRDYTVSELIGRSFPVSVQLGILAMLLAAITGVGLGIVAALHRNSALDKVVMGFAMTGISIPVFVIAPVLVLPLPQVAYIARLTRASLIEVLSSDFIRTARAQGLGTAAIVRYHALKPAMLPVLSYMGPAVAAVLTGSVVVEEIFGIPGLGQLFVRGSLNRDYTLVLGVVIFYATLIVLLNLAVDLLYGAIDPRIRRR